MRDALGVSLMEDKDRGLRFKPCHVPDRRNPCRRGSSLQSRTLRNGSLRVIGPRRERRGPRLFSVRGGKLLGEHRW